MIIELLKELKDDTINLIYFDPPYNTGRDFYNFNDKFNTTNEYNDFMRERMLNVKWY